MCISWILTLRQWTGIRYLDRQISHSCWIPWISWNPVLVRPISQTCLRLANEIPPPACPGLDLTSLVVPDGYGCREHPSLGRRAAVCGFTSTLIRRHQETCIRKSILLTLYHAVESPVRYRTGNIALMMVAKRRVPPPIGLLRLKTGSNTGSDTLTRDPTRPKSLTRWPVTRRPGSISEWWHLCV